ncbi:MAG: cytochrome c1 [Proteobacteria bacterium]|nr:cytochrome c1 [Pseudomonadota bacterium]MBK7115154.1 cytochrome c1 [Pseudomonadota bacterium]MBK9252259.1 cytochrome c1 [Pseudomonadota bacterium]
MQNRWVRIAFTLAASFALGTGVAAAAEEGGHGGGAQEVHWESWQAGNEVTNTASLQRGATNFVNYCLSCHSMKYMRYSRMASDLGISEQQLRENLIATDAKPTDYMLASFPEAEAVAWFGKVPPDLSLVARYRGTDWVYQFLKGFYVDKTRPTGTNNLALEGAAMPAVLSDLEGVKAAVLGVGVSAHGGKRVERFETVAAGRMTPEEFDGFVRDTVNFLDYAGDPSQAQRRSIGIWVLLFLMVFTVFAWMLKKEYWKDVH